MSKVRKFQQSVFIGDTDYRAERKDTSPGALHWLPGMGIEVTRRVGAFESANWLEEVDHQWDMGNVRFCRYLTKGVSYAT